MDRMEYDCEYHGQEDGLKKGLGNNVAEKQ
jgi:hypothetical protein